MHISELDSLRNNPMIRFKEEVLDGQTLTIVHYMISNTELWDNRVTYEARGNVYNEEGDCICACFRKFFNVNERPETKLEVIKDHIVECQEKRDGSLVTPVISAKDRVVFKTKKSFISEVALLANACTTPEVIQVSRYFIEQGYTPLFEFTHPDAKIVLDYGPVPCFTLLSVRSFKTGQELSHSTIKQMLINLSNINPQVAVKIPMISTFPYKWSDVYHQISTAKGIEGFVLILDSGERVKIKTEEYLRLHRIHTEIRERDIAEAVVDETLDDILGVITQSNLDRTPITQIESQVISELTQIQQEVNAIAAALTGVSIKDAAISLQGNILFDLIMAKLRGKDPKIIKHWKKYYLKNYSLRCVYNTNF